MGERKHSYLVFHTNNTSKKTYNIKMSEVKDLKGLDVMQAYELNEMAKHALLGIERTAFNYLVNEPWLRASDYVALYDRFGVVRWGMPVDQLYDQQKHFI